METKIGGYIIRDLNEIEFSDTEKENAEKLLEIIKNNKGFELGLNDYEIDKEYNITTPNSTWFLLRKEFMDDKMNVYNLKEGDILKIGRILLRIRTIRFSKNNNYNKKDKNNDEKSINTNFSQSLQEIRIEHNTIKKKEPKEPLGNKLCRICYGEEDNEENPLLQPCTCSGSMKYIHLSCLKTWINTSVNIKLESTEYCNIYSYKPAECELCKTTFPDFMRHKGKLYEILDFYDNFSSYLIFECLVTDKTQNKYIYVVNLDIPDNKVNIGRGHNSNILLNDISVSRLHCILEINKNAKKLFISDNNSKFGTLALVQTNFIKLAEEIILHLQIGRTYLKILVKKPMSLFSCCGVSEKKDSDYYYLQNKDKQKFTNKLTVKTENETTEGNEIEEKLVDEKEETKDIKLMKTKVKLMDENDIEGLLLTKPFETNVNNNENNENENIEKELIDEEDKNDKDSSIVINDEDNNNNNNQNNNKIFSDDNSNQNEIILDKNNVGEE